MFTSPESDTKAIPRQIGVGWYHDKGDGFCIVLDATPIDGMIVCFLPRETGDSDSTDTF